MITKALIRLGLVEILMGTLLGIGFMVKHVPGISPYTDWVFGLQIAGFVMLIVGLVLKELI